MATMPNRSLNRRDFLKLIGMTGAALGVGGAAALPATVRADGTPTPTPPPPTPAPAGHNMTGTPGAVPIKIDAKAVEEMDRMHEVGVKDFLANAQDSKKVKDFWGAEMPFRMDGSTKVFDIVCTEGPWEVAPGQVVNAMMYNGRVPGPTIRATQGENVRLIVENRLSQSTAIHFHGIHTPNSMDGVPYITQPPIKPGQTFTYEFVAKNAGTHMYHSHHNAAEQVTRGLMGAFIIDPTDKSLEPKVDGDFVMVLNDAGIGMSLNGKSFPATLPIIVKKGQRIRVRYLNEGLQIHPMHLHGMYQKVIAKDGFPLPIPYLTDTLNVAPGERYDVVVDCEEPGAWAFHCHILTHAESDHGMFGMVTALVIT